MGRWGRAAEKGWTEDSRVGRSAGASTHNPALDGPSRRYKGCGLQAVPSHRHPFAAMAPWPAEAPHCSLTTLSLPFPRPHRCICPACRSSCLSATTWAALPVALVHVSPFTKDWTVPLDSAADHVNTVATPPCTPTPPSQKQQHLASAPVPLPGIPATSSEHGCNTPSTHTSPSPVSPHSLDRVTLSHHPWTPSPPLLRDDGISSLTERPSLGSLVTPPEHRCHAPSIHASPVPLRDDGISSLTQRPSLGSLVSRPSVEVVSPLEEAEVQRVLGGHTSLLPKDIRALLVGEALHAQRRAYSK